jgi:exodeoxyribonuclease VII large subunit
MEKKIYTVREVTRCIKAIIEKEVGFVWVKGEISNFKAHPSGHFYFSLKDEYSQLPCVMFREENKGITFKPKDGLEINAYGRIGVYEKQGVYQLYVYDMNPVGIGELALRFEALKKKLKEEGLFDKEHKKPLPDFPLSIGIVTASSGAAIQDILNILSRRAPYIKIVIKPVKVQGINSAKEIAEAIREFNTYGDVDLLIVGRGGGSIEDLWAFNEEIVAREIFASEIPIVSAVGHEIDFTISDFVADLRAPTPSAAAELTVRDKNEILDGINHFLQTSQRLLFRNFEQKNEVFNSLTKRYGIARVIDTIREKKQIVDEYERRITSRSSYTFSLKWQLLDALDKRLNGLNPSAVLERGYSIARRLPGMEIVSSVKTINLYDRLLLEFVDGNARTIVDKKNLQTTKENKKIIE